MSDYTKDRYNPKGDERATKPISRRSVFKMGLASSVALPMSALGQSPNRLRPQPGDQLVFEEGPNMDALVRPKCSEMALG